MITNDQIAYVVNRRSSKVKKRQLSASSRLMLNRSLGSMEDLPPILFHEDLKEEFEKKIISLKIICKLSIMKYTALLHYRLKSKCSSYFHLAVPICMRVRY